VISEWQLELPGEVRQFDYDTISDVILHLRYTARAGGGLLRNGAIANLEAQIAAARTAGSVRLFSVRHEFPNVWARFQRTPANSWAELQAIFREEHYPFWSKGRLGSVERVDLYAQTGASELKISAHDDGSGDLDTLTVLAKDGETNVLAGQLTNVPHPTVPADPEQPENALLKLYVKQPADKAIEDLWIAVTWGS